MSSFGITVRDHPQLWASAVVALNRYWATGVAAAQRPAAPLAAGGGPPAPSTADHVRARGKARSAIDHDDITVMVVVDPGYHVNANPASLDYL